MTKKENLNVEGNLTQSFLDGFFKKEENIDDFLNNLKDKWNNVNGAERTGLILDSQLMHLSTDEIKILVRELMNRAEIDGGYTEENRLSEIIGETMRFGSDYRDIDWS